MADNNTPREIDEVETVSNPGSGSMAQDEETIEPRTDQNSGEKTTDLNGGALRTGNEEQATGQLNDQPTPAHMTAKEGDIVTFDDLEPDGDPASPVNPAALSVPEPSRNDTAHSEAEYIGCKPEPHEKCRVVPPTDKADQIESDIIVRQNEADQGPASGAGNDEAKCLEGQASSPTTNDPDEVTKKNKDILKAIMDKDAEKFQTLLDQGANIEAKFEMHENGYDADREKFTLYLAARYCASDIMAKILSRASEINIKSVLLEGRSGGWTPLHIASQIGEAKVVELLLFHDADIGATTIATFSEVAPYIAAGEDCNLTVETCLQPVAKGHASVVKVLLKHGTNIEAKATRSTLTALYMAAAHGKKEVIEIFLKSRADVKNKSNNGWTPLHSAVTHGYTGVIELLLPELDIDTITAEGNDGATALTLAIEAYEEGIVLLLMKQEIKLLENPQAEDTYHVNRCEVRKVQEWLFDRLFFGNSQTFSKEEALFHWAVLNKADPLAATLYLKHREDLQSPRSVARDGETLLHVAAHRGLQYLAHALLRSGVGIMAKDPNDHIALDLAAIKGHDAVVLTLLEDSLVSDQIRCKSKNGETALHLAAINGHDAQSKIVERTEHGKAPLSLAVNGGYQLAAVRLLWGMPLTDLRKDVGALEDTPNLVAKAGKLETLLLVYKEDLSTQKVRGLEFDSTGWTPLHWAVYHGHRSVVSELFAKRVKPKDVKIAKIIAGKMKRNSSRSAGDIDSEKATKGKESSKIAYAKIFDILHKPPVVEGAAYSGNSDGEPKTRSIPAKQRDLCEKFDATIVDFFEENGRTDFQPRLSNVFEVIYGDGPEKVMSGINDAQERELREGDRSGRTAPIKSDGHTLKTIDEPTATGSECIDHGEYQALTSTAGGNEAKAQAGSRSHFRFRWIHVAVNNTEWIEDLTLKICKTNKEHFELSEFVKRGSHERSGVAGRVRYMKPLCTQESKVLDTEEPKGRKQQKPISRVNRPEAENQKLKEGRPVAPEKNISGPSNFPGAVKADREKQHGELCSDNYRAAEKIQNKQSEDKLIKNDAVKSKSRAGSQLNAGLVDAHYRTAIYMPYLTFSFSAVKDPTKEVAPSLKDNENPQRDAYLQLEKLSKGKLPSNVNISADDWEPISVHKLHEQLTNVYKNRVHESRTLDQYYYSLLDDTDFRDGDQVVTRYFSKQNSKKTCVLRVDQLWLWVVDESIIAAASSQKSMLIARV
ncbi:MAG: hypothetical protein M1834_001053 [Cirrosporium novae-zelandiae]|nr:MAG: hypothetical protein M1834_001053 [Cirrosporium novae-zelandiae]